MWRYVLAGLGLAGGAFAGHRLLVRTLSRYPVVSHEDPFEDPRLITEFGLAGRRTPADFQFPQWEDWSYRSAPDALRLGGWFIPAEAPEARRAVVFVHGHTSNRLKPLTYLSLLRRAGLHRTHHFFLPDLRNSGTSDPAPTAMGYHFAEDLCATLETLHARRGIDRFILYAFSMGAMASALLLNRADLRERMERRGLRVERMIFDSPLANAVETVRWEAEVRGVPHAVARAACWAMNLELGGALYRMRLGPLLEDVEVPTLILQAADDTVAPRAFLQAERPRFGPQVEVVEFPQGGHVKMYRDAAQRPRYQERVTAFLRDQVTS